ncbi:MAG: phosphoribosyl-ATP diphosphatase [Planctomycetota bacterium]
MSDEYSAIRRLMETLTQRVQERPAGSYTTKLVEGGVDKIAKKIREEAEELIEAAGEDGPEGREHFVYEAGDLIFHTLVLLAYRGVDLAEVSDELARREGVSGLVEKANRVAPPDSNSS